MKKVVVHSSTNPHYVEGVTKCKPDERVEIKQGEKAVFTHTEHESISTFTDAPHKIGFVKVYDPAFDIIRRVRD